MVTAPAAATVGALLPAGRRRIVVAMSGGVDSSVAAALLKREGHEVIGITLQLYDHAAAAGRKGSCCAGQDIHDARRVAAALGIAHYVLDYEQRFQRAVMQPFADSYIAGETPIPCVACNQQIKFHDLLHTARELGADALATGHYIARRDGPGGPELRRAADAERDQSYFLFATTRAQLAQLMFPLGGLKKSEVRSLARELGLPVADKADSQDICFVPSGRYGDVIQRLRPEAIEPGQIVHVDGRVLGRHEGVVNYTVGQRRGLKLAVGDPMFVVRIDAERREVVVGPRESLAIDTLRLRDVNWLGDQPLTEAALAGLEIHARIRSTNTPRPATLAFDPQCNAISVRLASGEHGIAKGQACVFYADGVADARVLGGGWIAGTALAANTRPAAAE